MTEVTTPENADWAWADVESSQAAEVACSRAVASVAADEQLVAEPAERARADG